MKTHILVKLSLLFALTLFTACSSGGGGQAAIQAPSSDTGTNSSKLSQSLFNLTNSLRSGEGRSSLSGDALLTKRAQEKALSLSQAYAKSGNTKDALDHSGFSSFSFKARGHGYIATAENVAWSYTSATSGISTNLLNMLNQSPSHRKNMMDKRWSNMGVAVVKRGNNYHAVQVFGTK